MEDGDLYDFARLKVLKQFTAMNFVFFAARVDRGRRTLTRSDERIYEVFNVISDKDDCCPLCFPPLRREEGEIIFVRT